MNRLAEYNASMLLLVLLVALVVAYLTRPRRGVPVRRDEPYGPHGMRIMPNGSQRSRDWWQREVESWGRNGS